jgi:hypothetical protein
MSMESLSDLYFDKNVWMTSVIFKKWLMSWSIELKWKSRNILLVLDNSTALIIRFIIIYYIIYLLLFRILKNMQMEFLSPNTTSPVQPMDMEIITNLKTLYCPKLVSDILQEIQENLLTSSSAAKEISERTSTVYYSWRRVSTYVIQICFSFCGFKHSNLEMPSKADSENDVILEIHHVRDHKIFSCIENNLQCYKEN